MSINNLYQFHKLGDQLRILDVTLEQLKFTVDSYSYLHYISGSYNVLARFP